MSAPTIGTPVGRWAGFGPYYAMFPMDFAFDVVAEHCPPNGSVFDPFAGRGSSIYAAAAQGRSGLGIEINPVGWIFGRVKLQPAPQASVMRRLKKIGKLADAAENQEWLRQAACDLPEFYEVCYAPQVLRFLLMARRELRWKKSATDATLMAIILVHLHAKEGGGLSNQMRQSKAMSPNYSVAWWRKNGKEAPDIDAVEWLEGRIARRYATGLPELARAEVWLGDGTKKTNRILNQIARGQRQQFDLLFTSPPYCAITNYQYDQWLRLWMLGQPPHPVGGEVRSSGRFQSRPAYRDLIRRVFASNAALLREDATIYVRTDARDFTRETTEAILREVFPRKHFEMREKPLHKSSQTPLFGDKTAKPGEVDMILTP